MKPASVFPSKFVDILLLYLNLVLRAAAATGTDAAARTDY